MGCCVIPSGIAADDSAYGWGGRELIGGSRSPCGTGGRLGAAEREATGALYAGKVATSGGASTGTIRFEEPRFDGARFDEP
eukprot:scaffold232132_cov22-Tisochrysis_lutea.AAC.2